MNHNYNNFFGQNNMKAFQIVRLPDKNKFDCQCIAHIKGIKQREDKASKALLINVDITMFERHEQYRSHT